MRMVWLREAGTSRDADATPWQNDWQSLQPDRPPAMSGQTHDTSTPVPARSGRIALLIALLALAGTAAQWLGLGGERGPERAQRDELAKTQRRISSLEDRLARERDDLARLGSRLGPAGSNQESIAARVGKLEDSLAKLPGGEHGRSAWLIDQAAYFLRAANAQANLAGDSRGALKALDIADEHLREAADPRLLSVRRLIASEQAALRTAPVVDTEGLILQLDALAGQIHTLSLRQAPAQFRPVNTAAPAELTGVARALETLRKALLSVISVRRTEAPAAPLATAETGTLVTQGLALELQIARLAVLRGEPQVLRTSLAEARRQLTQYFDTRTGTGASALAALDAIPADVLPAASLDISASLVELNRLRERESQP